LDKAGILKCKDYKLYHDKEQSKLVVIKKGWQYEINSGDGTGIQ
jgi:hypothetical protein